MAVFQSLGQLEGESAASFCLLFDFLTCAIPTRFLSLFTAVNSCIYDGVGVEASGIWDLHFYRCLHGWPAWMAGIKYKGQAGWAGRFYLFAWKAVPGALLSWAYDMHLRR